jgi:hypothetical protein
LQPDAIRVERDVFAVNRIIRTHKQRAAVDLHGGIAAEGIGVGGGVVLAVWSRIYFKDARRED